MGASPDDDADRKVEKPVDDNWTSGSSIHNDRTTHGLYVDPESVAKLTAGKPDVPEHDRTTIGTGDDRIVPAVEPAKKDDSSVVAIDHLMAEMEHDKSAPGLGAGTPVPTPMTPVTPVLRFGAGKIPLEKEHELAQPERSPLSFVMRDMEPSAAPAAPASSGDSSRFVAAFVGDQPPPPVEPEPAPVTSLQPVSRRSRRKLYIAGGALAAAAVLTAGLAIKLTGSDAAPPKPTATANVVEAAPQPQPPPPPTQQDPLYGTTPAAEPVAETPAPQPPAPAQTDAKPVIAKKTVATKDATPKRTSTKKTATKTTAKKTTAKKSTAKKTPAKKSTRSQRSGRRTVR